MCHSTVVQWNYLYAFVQKVARCLWRSFCDISLSFNESVSSLRVVKEGSEVSVPDFGNGLRSNGRFGVGSFL